MAVKRTEFDAVVVTIKPGGRYTVNAVLGTGKNAQTFRAYPTPDKGIQKHNSSETVNITKEKRIEKRISFACFETHGSPGYINIVLPNGNLLRIPVGGC